jgi:hypothetical protein
MFEKSGVPMTAAQKGALQEIAARFAGEDDARRANYSEDTPALQRVLEEMAMKERFYREARGALGPEQLALISDPMTQGYTGVDVIGTGVAWAQFARPVGAADGAAFGKELGEQLTSKLQLADADAQRVRAIVQKWTAQIPQEVWTTGDPTHRKLNFLPVSSVHAAAQVQLGMMQEILGSVPLSAEQRKQLLKSRAIYVPQRP